MKKLKKTISVCVAVFLTFAFLIGSVPFNTTVKAEKGNEIWYQPKAADGMLKTGTDYLLWNGNLTLTDLSNGGVNWKCQHNGVGIRQGWKQTFALDGLTLKFSGLENSNAAASLLIYLSSTALNSLEVGVDTCATDYGLIAIDTADGELRFENDGATTEAGKTRIRKDGSVIVKSDLLKYDSLKAKDFEISFLKVDDGYKIGVKVGDKSVDGVLKNEKLTKLTKLNDLSNVYVGLGNNQGNNGWTNIKLVGIGPVEKSTILKKELTVNDIAGQNYWPDKLATENSITGGLRFCFTSSFRNIRLGVNDSVSLDGMYLQLNNIQMHNKITPRILFILSNNKNAEAKDGMFGLILDTDSGSLKLNYTRDSLNDSSKEDIILKNDLLKYDNIRGKTVTVRTFKNSDGSYKLTVKINSIETLEGTITVDMLKKATQLTNYDTVYLTVHPGVNQNAGLDESFSVDIVEFWSSVMNSNTVINAIESIGIVSLENAQALREARSAYDQLLSFEKSDVTNADKLFAAEKEFVKLAQEADKSLTYMSKSNAKLSSSSDTSQLIEQSWASFIKLNDVENGGLHFDFTGSPLNVREGYKGNVDLDGLYLQFDRFSALNAQNAKFVLMLGNGNNYGVEYSEPRNAYPLTLVLDPSVGSITVMPKNEIVIQDDSLKLENLIGERFAYEFSAQNDGGYDFVVKVSDKTLKGIISDEAVLASISLTKSDECTVMLTAWESNSNFSLDFIGFKQTKLAASDVMALIDEIGIVGIDSGEKINAALTAYDSLADKSKGLVDNYDTLVALNNYYLGLEFNTMIFEAEDLIDQIGEIGYKSGEMIRDAKLAFDRLNSEQQKKVSNADVLQKAIKDYNKLCSDKIIYESYAYPINLRFTSTQGMGDWWKYSSFETVENKALRINFEKAIRDVRNGPNTSKSLDGLIMRIANLTPDLEGDGSGVKLSIQIGTSDNNYRGGVNLTAFALVLDTYEGALYGYPGNRLIIKDDALKQANIDGKEILIRFDKTEESLYRIQLEVDNNTLYGVIPTSLIDNSLINLDPESVKIALSPWVNNDDGISDNSLHTFSVDFLSCQSTGKYAFEDLYDLMDKIDKLPSTIKSFNETEVLELSNAYRELPRTMRAYVKNYSKLAAAIDKLYDLNAEDVTLWDNASYNKPSNGNTTISPLTGEKTVNTIIFSAFAISLAIIAFLLSIKSKCKES